MLSSSIGSFQFFKILTYINFIDDFGQWNLLWCKILLLYGNIWYFCKSKLKESKTWKIYGRTFIWQYPQVDFSNIHEGWAANSQQIWPQSSKGWIGNSFISPNTATPLAPVPPVNIQIQNEIQGFLKHPLKFWIY